VHIAKHIAAAAVQDAIKTTGMKLMEYKDLTHHLTQYFKCMLAAVKESMLPLQLKGVSMARLQVRRVTWARAHSTLAACATLKLAIESAPPRLTHVSSIPYRNFCAHASSQSITSGRHVHRMCTPACTLAQPHPHPLASVATTLQAYEEDLVTRFDAVKQRAFAWGMFSAQNLFSSDALLNGAMNAEGQCPDSIAEVRCGGVPVCGLYRLLCASLLARGCQVCSLA
jgi:hypothetical protein